MYLPVWKVGVRAVHAATFAIIKSERMTTARTAYIYLASSIAVFPFTQLNT